MGEVTHGHLGPGILINTHALTCKSLPAWQLKWLGALFTCGETLAAGMNWILIPISMVRRTAAAAVSKHQSRVGKVCNLPQQVEKSLLKGKCSARSMSLQRRRGMFLDFWQANHACNNRAGARPPDSDRGCRAASPFEMPLHGGSPGTLPGLGAARYLSWF